MSSAISDRTDDTDVFTDFNPLTQDLSSFELSYDFRPFLYYKTANALAKTLEKVSNGTIQPWLASIKSTDDEDMTKAASFASTLSAMCGNKCNILQGRLARNNEPQSNPEWRRAHQLRLLSIVFKHFAEREFDDWSFAFYVATMKGFSTLEQGFDVCVYTYETILEKVSAVA